MVRFLPDSGDEQQVVIRADGDEDDERRRGHVPVQLLMADELEEHHPEPQRGHERDHHGGNEIQRCDDRTQQRDQDQEHDRQSQCHDQPKIVLIVAADGGVHRGGG